MAEISFIECIKKLAESQLGSAKCAYQVQPKISRSNAEKKLKKKAFGALFSHLESKSKQKKTISDGPIPEVEAVLFEVERFRSEGRHLEADRLLNLLDSLKTEDHVYLRLLVALKGQGKEPPKPRLGDGIFGYDVSTLSRTGVVEKKSKCFAPSLLEEDDMDLSYGSSRTFMHYPSHVFATIFGSVETENERDLTKMFLMSPGKSLGDGGFFTPENILHDLYEEKTRDTLFGGLVQGKAGDINSFFNIPEIDQTPDIRIPEFAPKKSVSLTQLSEESGVESGGPSMSSSVMTLADQSDHDPWFWVNALKAPRNYNYTWEWIGYAPGPTEKPHLFEAGPAVFDLLLRHRRRVLAIMFPDEPSTLSTIYSVDQDVLVKNVLRMLIGVPSTSLPFDSVTMRFEVCRGLQVSGVSPEMLSDFLTEFLECGTFYRRLAVFSEAPAMNSFYLDGLVFQAFTVAVRKALLYFTGAVLKTPSTLKLFELKKYMHHSMEQIKYLAKLCHCYDGPPKFSSTGDGRSRQVDSDFPTGMNLLSYLYKEASIAMNSRCYPLLLSIFQTTSAPFVLFIQDWVFHGVLRGSCDEFMIKVNPSCLQNRDETYWSLAYTLNSGAAVPSFMKDIVEDIVVCGKSINLLKVCSRQHFLCNLMEREVPSVHITYSREVLQAMELDCQAYLGRMMQKSRQLTVDREEMMKKAEEAKAALQQTVRRMADKEISRLQGIIDSRRKKSQDKKRKEFNRLKQQMEDDMKRRAGEKQAEKDEEVRLMARITREENAMTEEEIKLEQQAREELVQYYTELSEEAAHRERRALWKIQRARQSILREEFLERDAEQWRRKLKKLQDNNYRTENGSESSASRHAKESGSDVVDYSSTSGDVELPLWVQKHGGGDAQTPLEVSGEEQITLPAWAARELPPVVDEEEDEIEEEGSDDGAGSLEHNVHLPSWVLREAEDEDEESPRVIDDSGEQEEIDTDSERAVDVGARKTLPASNYHARNVILGDQDDASATIPGHEEVNARQLKAVLIGGSPLPKPFIKTSTAFHPSTETEEAEIKSGTHTVQGKHVTNESSDPGIEKPHIKLLPGASASLQSDEVEVRPHVKASNMMSATQQSDPADINSKTHVKFIEGANVNQQTTEEHKICPSKGKSDSHENVSSESLPQVWVIKKPSLFGHVSQLSGSDYVLTAPKLKRQILQHANAESEYKDFSMKPRVRMSRNMSATKESSELNRPYGSRKTQIRMVQGRGVNVESDRIDENEVARKRFLARNSKGHSSDSTIQRLLYGNTNPSWLTLPSTEEDVPDGPVPKISFTPGLSYQPNTFDSDYKYIVEHLCVDLMADKSVIDLGRDLVDSDVSGEENVEAYKQTPLSVLLARSFTAPIKAQISLVNSAVVNYFTGELRIDDHFVAIQRYLLMGDGDFAEILANIIFEKLSTNPLPQEIFSPLFLNGALAKAIGSSIYSDDKHIQNLNFALTHLPSVLMPNAANSLSCLELRYTVKWPLNVILTRDSMKKYCKIFSFLLQLKRVVWTLKDVWHRLKRDALVVRGASSSTQFRHLQLHRQEMEHFVKAMQGYITSQVIHVSWQEFQAELAQPIAGLSQLQARHQRYVDKAVAKCMLHKKAAEVMKIIQDIFNLILKFRSQLVSASWRSAGPGGEAVHPNFEAIVHTHKSFHVYSFFLFKVVNRLSQKGYQPHLQELLLQLNFNDFYREAAT
ncbi:gamma-tubulin complex component 6 [Elysia marginata]|uniref:Gamma-tubulin complex component 6 n=1 Tax=Elysia marginata TaxID=1093978 RepID=A0AAV4FWG4_9GAST|nr:gamma-tubulin complex component 6 [Elysia marginata]